MQDIINKGEKLVSSLYFITSFFDDREPAKWQLRTLSLEFVKTAVLFKDNLFHEHEMEFMKLRSLVLEVISLLLVMKPSGMISEINHSLLESEFTGYLQMLQPSNELFDDDGRLMISSRFFDPHKTAKIENVQAELESHNVSDIRRRLSISSNNELPTDQMSLRINTRRNSIINIISKRKDIMIKDLTNLINGCSEKTIQRELSNLVRKNVLKKTGQKRWTRYSLV